MRFDAYIFDLDGTLLNTLPDLVRLTNMTLQERGWPQRTRDEVLSFVGNGGRVLIERAAPAGTAAVELDSAFERWRDLYPTYGHALTKPYEGMAEALEQLKGEGAKLGVLSNKFDAAVQQVIADQFPGVFHLARGECDEIPRKPDPTGLQYMMRQLGVEAARTAYVGDSPSDVQVAHAAGAFAIAVTWGYRSAEDLAAANPEKIIGNPLQLLDL